MLRLHLSFRCHRPGHGRPRLQVVLLGVLVGLMMDQVVVVPQEIWVDLCRDGGRQDSDCCCICPRSHQHQVWE